MFEKYTPQYLWEEIRPNIDTNLFTNEGSYLYDVYGPALLEIYKVYLSMNALEPMFYIDETSGPYIDKMANSFGITRKPGVKATCKITFAGSDGASVPAGAVFLTADNLAFVLAESVVIAAGSAVGTLDASEPGAKYNISSGEIKKAQRNYSGIASFSNDAAAGGVDEESDKSLVNRFYAQLRQPATSGNGFHYQQWAREVPGVGGARVIGLWNGPGTVKVLLVDDAMHPVDDAVASNAQAHIDEQRPVGPAVTCVAAASVPVNISATVQIKPEASLSAILAEFKQAMTVYLDGLVSDKFCVVIDASRDDLSGFTCTVVYNKVLGLLIDCDGVIDCSDLLVNAGTDNIVVDAQSVPVLGEVALNG